MNKAMKAVISGRFGARGGILSTEANKLYRYKAAGASAVDALDSIQVEVR